MVNKWMLMVTMVVMVATASAQDRRVAEATWQQVDGCETVTTHAIATLAAVGVFAGYPDGWARDVLITVEHRDTCTGTQLANLAGQVTPQPDQLDISRKLDSATVSTVVAVWDGVTNTGGNLVVTITWDAVSKRRNTSVRPASAILAADGFGLSLRNYTLQATISEQ